VRGWGLFVAAAAVALCVASGASAGSDYFKAGNLVVSRTVYDGNAGTVQVGETLPPGCTSGCGAAISDGRYPAVFDNDLVDGSFGITSRIFLDQLTPSGGLVGSLEVPNSTQNGVPSERDQLVTSFPSKSELALNLSTDGSQLSFMGYVAPVDALDVSNSNTPGVSDPTNPVPSAYYRAVATVDAHGKFRYALTNAYSGNNGRAAIVNATDDVIYAAGNAGNGANPQPDGVIVGGGAQIMSPQVKAEIAQTPGTPTPVGSFSITQLPGNSAPDKVGKDTNFRGMTIFDNVLYYTKGSGSNGVDTVYFVDTTNSACPDGVGLPVPSAPLPNAPIDYDATALQMLGVAPYNMCVLSGFPTILAKSKANTSFPFGMWFANAHTLYVADEGNGTNTFSTASGTYTAAAAQKTAGLQKWQLVNGSWQRAYTLQDGLELGVPYNVADYPTGINAATGLPWSPATDGLRNITGRVGADGSATIYAITSTVSGGGDQGADPNKLVAITDNPAATTPAPGEAFNTVRSAGYEEALRGVAWAPGTTG